MNWHLGNVFPAIFGCVTVILNQIYTEVYYNYNKRSLCGRIPKYNLQFSVVAKLLLKGMLPFMNI